MCWSKDATDHGAEGLPWSHWTKLDKTRTWISYFCNSSEFSRFWTIHCSSESEIPVWTRVHWSRSVHSCKKFLWTINIAMKNSEGRKFLVGSVEVIASAKSQRSEEKQMFWFSTGRLWNEILIWVWLPFVWIHLSCCCTSYDGDALGASRTPKSLSQEALKWFSYG